MRILTSLFCLRAQKIHIGSDTTLLDSAHSLSDSIAAVKSGRGVDTNADVHSQQSCGPNTEHSPSGGTPLKPSKKASRPQDGVNWEEALKLGSTPESLSPTVQITSQCRSLDLSPQSTQSESSSQASMGGLDGIDGAVTGVSSGAGTSAATGVSDPVLAMSSLWTESSLEREVRNGEGGRRSGSDIWEEDSLSNWSSGIEIGKSDDSEGMTVTKGITTFPSATVTSRVELERDNNNFVRSLAPASGSSPYNFSRALCVAKRLEEVGSKQSVCSPPGLSKKQPSMVASEQQLPLSKQSEMLELEAETPLIMTGISQSRPEHRHDLARQDRGCSDGDVGNAGGGGGGDNMRPLSSSNNGTYNNIVNKTSLFISCSLVNFLFALLFLCSLSLYHPMYCLTSYPLPTILPFFSFSPPHSPPCFLPTIFFPPLSFPLFTAGLSPLHLSPSSSSSLLRHPDRKSVV